MNRPTGAPPGKVPEGGAARTGAILDVRRQRLEEQALEEALGEEQDEGLAAKATRVAARAVEGVLSGRSLIGIVAGAAAAKYFGVI